MRGHKRLGFFLTLDTWIGGCGHRGEVLLWAILSILSRRNRNDRMLRMYRIQDFGHGTNPAKSSRLRRQTADAQSLSGKTSSNLNPNQIWGLGARLRRRASDIKLRADSLNTLTPLWRK